MNGAAFKEYLRSQLGATLEPGDIVICDNLPAHKGEWTLPENMNIQHFSF